MTTHVAPDSSVPTCAVMAVPAAAQHVVVCRSYEGRVVAKLPFEPFSLLAKITRRGIEKTDDLTFCAWVRRSNQHNGCGHGFANESRSCSEGFESC